MRVEENGLVWCVNWAIGRFMLRSAGHSPIYLEGVLLGGLEELGIGPMLTKDRGFLRSLVSRRA